MSILTIHKEEDGSKFTKWDAIPSEFNLSSSHGEEI